MSGRPGRSIEGRGSTPFTPPRSTTARRSWAATPRDYRKLPQPRVAVAQTAAARRPPYLVRAGAWQYDRDVAAEAITKAEADVAKIEIAPGSAGTQPRGKPGEAGESLGKPGDWRRLAWAPCVTGSDIGGTVRGFIGVKDALPRRTRAETVPHRPCHTTGPEPSPPPRSAGSPCAPPSPPWRSGSCHWPRP